MSTILDSLIVSEIQSLAVDAACGAGQILKSYFGSQIQVDYKGKGQSDPVSVPQKESGGLSFQLMVSLLAGVLIVVTVIAKIFVRSPEKETPEL